MLLEIENLTVGYGGAPAIWRHSLTVDEREVVSVIGPNGAGKSTLINTIAGLLRAERGSLRLAGVDLVDVAPHQVCVKASRWCPKGGGFSPACRSRRTSRSAAFVPRRARLRAQHRAGLRALACAL